MHGSRQPLEPVEKEQSVDAVIGGEWRVPYRQPVEPAELTGEE